MMNVRNEQSKPSNKLGLDYAKQQINGLTASN